MFKSTNEFNRAIQSVLKSLLDEFSTIEELQTRSELNDEDFVEATKQAVDVGYIDGLAYVSGVGNSIAWSVDKPHPSYAGLQFIESSRTP